MDARVKDLVDKHLDESDVSGDEEDEEIYMSEADCDSEREDDGMEEIEETEEDEEDEEDEESIILDYEQGKYERSKMLKIKRRDPMEMYKSVLASDEETPDDLMYKADP